MDGNQLGRNIKHLRELHDETLEELGAVIHCAKSTVKGYENGSRKPDFQTLQSIAAHYNMPVDELLHADLTELEKPTLDLNSLSGMIDLMNAMMPLCYSEAAMKNNNFKRGYELSQRLLHGFSNAENFPGSIIYQIFEAFLNAAGESKEPEAIANVMWCIFIW